MAHLYIIELCSKCRRAIEIRVVIQADVVLCRTLLGQVTLRTQFPHSFLHICAICNGGRGHRADRRGKWGPTCIFAWEDWVYDTILRHCATGNSVHFSYAQVLSSQLGCVGHVTCFSSYDGTPITSAGQAARPSK